MQPVFRREGFWLLRCRQAGGGERRPWGLRPPWSEAVGAGRWACGGGEGAGPQVCFRGGTYRPRRGTFREKNLVGSDSEV